MNDTLADQRLIFSDPEKFIVQIYSNDISFEDFDVSITPLIMSSDWFGLSHDYHMEKDEIIYIIDKTI